MAALRLKTRSWRVIGSLLGVPNSKCDSIEKECDTDEERLVAVIKYWILRDPNASWRKLICSLDYGNFFDIADRIKEFAEKQTGQYVSLLK